MFSSKMELEKPPANKRVSIAVGMTDNETPARKAVMEAGVTPADIASELGVGRSTVQAWITGDRSIPRSCRDALAKPKGARKAIKAGVWKKIGA